MIRLPPSSTLFPSRRSSDLEIVVQQLCLAGLQFRSQNHVAQFYRVREQRVFLELFEGQVRIVVVHGDRKSTRLNSSHQIISYAVFCLKKKNNQLQTYITMCL